MSLVHLEDEDKLGLGVDHVVQTDDVDVLKLCVSANVNQTAYNPPRCPPPVDYRPVAPVLVRRNHTSTPPPPGQPRPHSAFPCHLHLRPILPDLRLKHLSAARGQALLVSRTHPSSD